MLSYMYICCFMRVTHAIINIYTLKSFLNYYLLFFIKIADHAGNVLLIDNDVISKNAACTDAISTSVLEPGPTNHIVV